MAFSPILISLVAITFSIRVLVYAVDRNVEFLSNASQYWINTNSTSTETYVFHRNLIFRAILQTGAAPELYGTYNDSISFAFGFYCDFGHGDTCLLSVVMLDSLNDIPEVIWVANRGRPVKENAALRADLRRGLVLTESDGAEAWSAYVSNGASVTSMSLGGDGDLVLLSSNESRLWRSFAHPTDALVLGQTLEATQSLTPMSGRFTLSLSSTALTASMEYESRRLTYLNFAPTRDIPLNATLRSVTYYGKNISFTYKQGSKSFSLYLEMNVTSPIGIVRIGSDGGVLYRSWDSASGWSSNKPLAGYEPCLTPLICGEYGVCMQGGCVCPAASDRSNYFVPDTINSPRGCRFADAIEPESTSVGYKLVYFGNLSYFSYLDPGAATVGVTELGKCRQACEGNATCKAAFFSYENNPSKGLCYLPSEVLTVSGVPIVGGLNTIASIKVPVPPVTSLTTSRTHPLGSSIGKAVGAAVTVTAFAITAFLIIYKIRRGRRNGKDCFDVALGGPMRFSYKELCSATRKFSTRLGRGGFGSVYKGELPDGTAIAVKKLDCIDQGTAEFMAEMKTTGSIHHYNLVKLIGFCADECNRLLVYEYMSNGSLDKRLFGVGGDALAWETRRRIVLDVARGLAYLHEGCNQRIAHLDMKPHNILLDDNYNAKISDFGLAKFIDRNQSQVVTAMRGTLGYLAPEWQNSRITVKADIYSFGVVILEAVSGRRNLDYTQDDANVHLLGVLHRKATEGRLIDIADEKIADRESHEEDIVNMIRIGAWCLNEDQAKRPLMSTVVKVLEGTMEMEKNIDFRVARVLILSSPSPTESSSESTSSPSL